MNLALYVRDETTKPLEENVGVNLCDPDLGKAFLHTTQKA